MALSGFPEWLPEGRRVEIALLDEIRRVFELHGFMGIETRSVEPVDVLLRKGEIDKEVYSVRRIHESTAEDTLALHFDLTVPLARYVVEHAGHLEFPFRRYQIQKVWRGERPQEGRFREFTQADIDIVDVDHLAFHHEIEMAAVMGEALARLPIPAATLRVNNRKLAEGFYRGVGVTDTAGVLRAVDKIEKIGPSAVHDLLVAETGLTAAAAQACVALAAIRTDDASFVDRVADLGVSDPLLDEGLAELEAVVMGVAHHLPGRVVADLSIARGLDYYTGTVYETSLDGHVDVGSVCSGGRYDTLASAGKRTYPGVGLSLGVTRLVAVLLGRNLVRVSRPSPSVVLVAVSDEATRAESAAVANALRARGVACEVSPTSAKFGKQIRFAERRGIPFVWFGDSVKDIRTGEQRDADPHQWLPPEVDMRPIVVALAPPAPGDPSSAPEHSSMTDQSEGSL